MAMKLFEECIAYLQETGSGVPRIVRGGVGELYRTTDVDRTTPLQAYAALGVPGARSQGEAFPVNSNAHGVLPGFYASLADEDDFLIWKSGTFEMMLMSATGRKGEPGVTGDPGKQGEPGTGVPAGGASLQQLRIKNGTTVTEWFSPRNAVDIRDFGAKVDGVTDDLDAIHAAIATGRPVYIPPGTTRIRSSVLMPSRQELFGAGMGRSVLKLTDTAPNGTWVVTNGDRPNGNTMIKVHDITLDWNYGPTRLGAAGGSRSSCLTFGNVSHSYVTRVEAIGCGQHGFDITNASIDYPYNGDGSPDAVGPSRYIYLKECIARDWNDDGFTTHHSEYIFISNCYAEFPRQRGNNNAFEIDDGSRHIFLSQNTSRRCYAGIEIKAHDTASAGRDVHINGHMSIEDVRPYNWRHIGHHFAAEPESLSAFDITAQNLVAYHPGNYDAFYDDASPRGLVISAFRGVSVDGFTAIGKPGYDYGGDSVIVCQYRARGISISGVNVRGFGNADFDIYLAGGDNGTRNVTLTGVNILNSAKSALYDGTTATGVTINGFNAEAPAVGAFRGLDIWYRVNASISGVTLTGYPVEVRADGIDHADVDEYLKKTAGGTVTLTATIPAGGFVGPITVNFPPGRFSVPPNITTSAGQGIYGVAVTNVTKDSFRLYVDNLAPRTSNTTNNFVTWAATPA